MSPRGAACALCVVGLLAYAPVAAPQAAKPDAGRYFMPRGAARQVVTVERPSAAKPAPGARVVIVTQALAIKESGPKETVERFGEVYAFSPSFVAVRREQPTLFVFMNLQPDDMHDFALLGEKGQVLTDLELPPLKKTQYVLTFHRAGVFEFACLRHMPAMAGQVLVREP